MPRRGLRFAIFGIWAVALTGLTFVLGATPLKALRAQAGRPAYWASGLLISLALAAAPAASLVGLGLAFFSLVVLVGTFAELEESGLSFSAAAFFTLVINALLLAGGFALWVSAVGPAWRQDLVQTLEAGFKPIADLNPGFSLNPAAVMTQLPSIVVILWMGALYLATLLGERLGAKSYRRELSELRLPDAAVWVFTASLLGAFGRIPGAPQGLSLVANNVLNVCLLLFFFQGIAVVAKFLSGLRLGAIPQTLLLSLVVLHLFWFVSLIGLMDHWLDFRGRLLKRPKDLKRGNV